MLIFLFCYYFKICFFFIIYFGSQNPYSHELYFSSDGTQKTAFAGFGKWARRSGVEPGPSDKGRKTNKRKIAQSAPAPLREEQYNTLLSFGAVGLSVVPRITRKYYITRADAVSGPWSRQKSNNSVFFFLELITKIIVKRKNKNNEGENPTSDPGKYGNL